MQNRTTALFDQIEIARVIWWDPDNARGFAVMITDGVPDGVYVHWNDFHQRIDFGGDASVTFVFSGLAIIGRRNIGVGSDIVFVRTQTERGPRAGCWTTKEYYEEARLNAP